MDEVVDTLKMALDIIKAERDRLLQTLREVEEQVQDYNPDYTLTLEDMKGDFLEELWTKVIRVQSLVKGG